MRYERRSVSRIIRCSCGHLTHNLAFAAYQIKGRTRNGVEWEEEPMCDVAITSEPNSIWVRIKTAWDVIWHGVTYRGGEVMVPLDELQAVVANLEVEILG